MRLLPKLELSFDENMYGTFHPVGLPEDRRTFMFHLNAKTKDFIRTALRDHSVEATGWVEAEGLAHHAPARGRMVIQPLVARRIRYELEFTGDDGKRWRYAGEKTIRHLSPLRTWTTLPGDIFEADTGIRRFESLTRFDLTELLPFLRSARLLPA